METLVTLKVSLVLHPIMTEPDTKQRIQKAAHLLVMQTAYAVLVWMILRQTWA